MKVSIASERCVGAGQCVLSAPALFDQDEEDGIAFATEERVPAGQEEQAHEAADLCPAKAIRLSDR